MVSGDAWGWFLAWAFVAEVIGTMAGFGAATVLTPVAILFMDAKTAVAVVACFHLFGNASRLRFFGRHVRWAIWWQFGLVGIVFSVLGAALTAHLASAMITLLVGLFLLGYTTADVAGAGRRSLPQTRWTLAGGGMASGLIAGLIGTGGAIRSACLLAFGLPRDVYIGTSAAIALVVDATRLPVYLHAGLVPDSMWPVVGGLLVVAFAGAWVGQHLVRRISADAFHRLVLLLLIVMGAKLTWDGWHQLLAQ